MENIYVSPFFVEEMFRCSVPIAFLNFLTTNVVGANAPTFLHLILAYEGA